ncbi:hypothetical protein [Kitasatospora aureofaciens]|uniref:hypothetical protein n=1 Tax=Kitasatospora aureofaciens TaxID=1894 RepID=UPI003815EA47
MNATPRPRSDQAEREKLARLLPAPAHPELPPGRHLLLKEHVMDTITADTRRTARRRTPALRVALPVGLAAALAAGVAVTAATGRPGADVPQGRITNVAYTLQSSGDDVVRLTVLEQDKPVDAAQLQRDLDHFGVHARVYAGEPGCRAPKPASPDNPADHDRGWDMGTEGRQTVLTIRPRTIPAGLQLFIHLPYATTDPADSWRSLAVGLMKPPAPACMPGATFTNPLAGLFPSPAH